MNLNNLNLYGVFLTVAQTGSILGASEKLFISQPAISKSIKRLEQNLDTILFTRSSKGVELTEDGQILYAQIRHAFDLIQSGESHIVERNRLGVGRIKIGVSNTLCKYVLLPFLSEYSRQNPHVSISIECQSSGDTIKMLSAGQIDIGLVARPEEAHPIHYDDIGQIKDTFVATPYYLERMRERSSNPDILESRANIMMLNKENHTRLFVEQFLPKDFYHENNLIETDNMDLLIEFAKSGIGIGCVIKEFVKKELKDMLLTEYLEGIPSIPSRNVSLAYSISHPMSPHTKDFSDYVLSQKNNPDINILAPV